MDLTTNYLGLTLKNPLVASAGPIARTVQGVQHLADAGVGAIVLPSLFEEQVRREAERDARLAETGTESFAESLSYLPTTEGEAGPRRYLDLLGRATAAVERPGHRQPQRRHRGRLDRLRGRHAGGGRRRDRAERLLSAR